MIDRVMPLEALTTVLPLALSNHNEVKRTRVMTNECNKYREKISSAMIHKSEVSLCSHAMLNFRTRCYNKKSRMKMVNQEVNSLRLSIDNIKP